MNEREPNLTISEADIRAVYHEGEEAVVSLFKVLIAQIERTEARLDTLENQTHKDSRNSSKPPSGDGFEKRTKSLRKKSERPSGGQSGHPGSTLEWCADVDEVVKHSVEAYESCGASLSAVATIDCERRYSQVWCMR